MKRYLPMLILLLTTVFRGWSASDDITITFYELEDYIRHPRMEEEDRLRGGNAAYRQGLEIITDVDDVEIQFFEESVGRTPAEWDDLAPGAYRVRLERSGFEIVEFWVEVKKDRRTVVYVRMGSPMGILKLNGLPPGAEVSFNRVPLEGHENKVTSGTGSLNVTAFGWEPVLENINIAPGETTEWTYEGKPTAFSLGTPVVRPRVLPGDDRRGFRIDWQATSPGSGRVQVIGDSGVVFDTNAYEINSFQGKVYWKPLSDTAENPAEGGYRVVVSGTGPGDVESSAESRLYIDNRFRREPRVNAHILPGLMYAPGTAILPPGIWQASTAAGFDIGTGTADVNTGVPVGLALRIAPGKRWELTGKFGMKARDPFDATSLDLSLSGAWRINGQSGPFEANLSLLYCHWGLAADFAEIPADHPGLELPGLQLSSPMEYAFGSLSLVLTPSINLFFAGDDPENWRLGGPARFTGSLGGGIYWENGRFLAGGSTALRTPDVSGDFLDWTLWSGIEGRFDLPGEASYFAGWCGVRYLDIDPVVSLGLEFGVIR